MRGLESRWFESHLPDRKQFVVTNGISSLLLNILVGVPHRLVLGPLLFLIYINDLAKYLALLSLLFTDDTTLSASDSNLNN